MKERFERLFEDTFDKINQSATADKLDSSIERLFMKMQQELGKKSSKNDCKRDDEKVLLKFAR